MYASSSRTALLAATVVGLSSFAGAAEVDYSGAEKLGWKLALQAWTNHRGTLFETLELAQRIGVRYVEAYPGQRISKDFEGKVGPEMTAELMAKVQSKARDCGVTFTNYGVTGIPANEQAARKLFAWAKKTGIQTLTSEPKEAQIPAIDKLAQEYGISVGIHNHAKPSHYWNPDILLAGVKGASRQFGACADTGHWVRSGLDPIECLKKLKGRIISLHFKDLNARERRAHDVPWGTGASDAAGQLAELKRQGFRGVISIEYEHQWDDETLAKCVQFFCEQATKLSSE